MREEENGYCCIGVLADIIDPYGWKTDDGGYYYYWNGQDTYLPHTLDQVQQNVLSEMNDGLGKTFEEIADYIEKEL